MSAATAPITTTTTPRVLTREATLSDAPALHTLINAAFNSDVTDQVFLTSFRGEIFPLSAITSRITSPDTLFLLTYYPSAPETIIGTCYVRLDGPESAWMGNLCIDPAHQKEGVGRFLLAESERYVVSKWAVKGMGIDVVSTRTELMAWYERCGYVKTGNVNPFPYGGAPEGFLREGMQLVDLRKDLVEQGREQQEVQSRGMA
jgi:ribosomal protein S18 acetylase RimI-like enzyme